jgi:glycosyltransferase involved in cell wall biosynthesis
LTADRSLRVVIFDRTASTNPYSRGLAAGLEGLGATVIVAGPAQMPDGGVVAVYPRGGVPGQRVAKGTDTIAGIARLARLIALKRPDVVHFQWATFYNYAIARTLKSLTRARLVFTVHVPEPRAGVTRWQDAMIRIADVLIVHSSRLRGELIRRHTVPENRVYVAPHGNYAHAIVHHDRAEARHRLGLPAGDPIFAFIGQLVPRKGVETLVEAFRRHCERGMPGILVIAGPAYAIDEAMLRRRLDPCRGRVRWMTATGNLPAEQLDLVVCAATQVVLPFEEAASAVSGSLLFAMTHGRCIVTTDVGENRSTLSGHGVIVPPGDVDAVADAMEIAFSDPARCDRLGQDVRAHVLAKYNWSRVAALTLRAYAAAWQHKLQRTHSVPEVADQKVHTSSGYE